MPRKKTKPKGPTHEQKIKNILKRVSKGVSVASACGESDTCGETAFYAWLKKDDEKGTRKKLYALAREERAEHHFEEIMDIADDARNDWMLKQTEGGGSRYELNGEHLQRSKLRIDARKWVLSKMSPRVYGDKIEHDLGDADITVIIKK